MAKNDHLVFIDMGYDRARQCFIAYNTKVNIVATGVCVATAKKNFKKIAKTKNIIVTDDD